MTGKVKLRHLSEVIQFSEKLWTEYSKDRFGKMEIPELVVTGLYRNSIELVDSIFVLADHGLEGPASICFRSYLEVVLALTYIINDPQCMEQRAKSYYVGSQRHTINEIKSRLLMIKGDTNSKEEEAQLKAKLAIVEGSLKQPGVKSTIIEWNRTKRKSQKKYEPKWHSLYEGPSTITLLAKYMQREDPILKTLMSRNSDLKRYYEISYAILSREAHSYTALDKYRAVKEGSNLVTMMPIRISTEEVLHGQYALANVLSIMLQINALFVVKLYPEYKLKTVDFAKELQKKMEE